MAAPSFLLAFPVLYFHDNYLLMKIFLHFAEIISIINNAFCTDMGQ